MTSTSETQDLLTATESSKVPERVLAKLRANLQLLREIRSGIDSTIRSLDEGMGGRGRYEAEALANRQRDITSGMFAVSEFRTMAARNSVDAEAVLAELGGVPDFTPSERARAWMVNDLAAQAGSALESIHPFGYRSRESAP